eukprot:3182888-Alexandrium_andersonii.AAC.1
MRAAPGTLGTETSLRMGTVSHPRPGQAGSPGTPWSHRMKSAKGMNVRMCHFGVGARIACGVVCRTPRTWDVLEEGMMSR